MAALCNGGPRRWTPDCVGIRQRRWLCDQRLYPSHEPQQQGRTGEQERASLRLAVSPAVGQQFVELLKWALADAQEDVFEPGEWIYLCQFARCNKAPQHRHGLPPRSLRRSSCGVPPRFHVSSARCGCCRWTGRHRPGSASRRSVFQRVGDGLPGFALGQHSWLAHHLEDARAISPAPVWTHARANRRRSSPTMPPARSILLTRYSGQHRAHGAESVSSA